MHPNPVFRGTAGVTSLAFARDRAFGMLAVAGEGAPLLAHVPFLLSEDGRHADLHLVRSNPIWRVPGPATLAVSGPDGYVSPDWYGLGPDQVPTWNYVAVHLVGRLEPLPPSSLEDMLVRQSAFFEERLPKLPWTIDKMGEDQKARLLRMILPFRLRIEDVRSTWKLGQNKPDAARVAAARHMPGSFGHELGALADAMAHPPQTD